ncbi:ABC transporter ATP-binding protein [Tepidibacter hydrothermalis]|uniref:ABC transporter ATP-binding protein n=1 Tax=Tepidibacter hydrothermalis TaxID=3036126 RepID=A0ABY8E7P7_9FIRM|nr:ABC transporter ATP-binding protein [Tepidibacter hydrothermalis]WFD08913.1 ABC transporter ATP-binding protein [Tepidibacter hydrothermalis]
MSQYIIKTNKLTKQYGQHLAVDAVSIHVECGKIYGLLGRNGAGKTTTMRMLMNLVQPTSGEIQLFGKNYCKKPKQIYQRIGSIIETPGFYENLTGEENLKILAKLRGIHRRDSIEYALSTVGLDNETKKTFRNYSLGMKQRLAIAAAIMHEPELLILDEPINGLDPIGIHEIRNYLTTLCKEKGVTILISSHILSEIEQIADTIGVMHDGKLIEEVSISDLHKRNRRYVEFEISDENKATLLLEEQMSLYDYSVLTNGNLRIYSNFNKRSEINKLFVENGLDVCKINMSEEKLEDYFSNLIGDGQIG